MWARLHELQWRKAWKVQEKRNCLQDLVQNLCRSWSQECIFWEVYKMSSKGATTIIDGIETVSKTVEKSFSDLFDVLVCSCYIAILVLSWD